jgi:hypothetical protein
VFIVYLTVFFLVLFTNASVLAGCSLVLFMWIIRLLTGPHYDERYRTEVYVGTND